MPQRVRKPNAEMFADYRRSAIPREATPDRKSHLLAVAALACAAVAIVGSLSPWYSSQSPDQPNTLFGFHTDGVLTLAMAAIAVIALVLILFRQTVELSPLVALLGLGLTTVIAGVDWLFLDHLADGLEVTQPHLDASTE